MSRKKSPFRNKKALQRFIDNPRNEETLDKWYIERMEIPAENEIGEVPYWIEQFQDDQYRCEYRTGYYEPIQLQETRTRRDPITETDVLMMYIDSINLGEEVEHQADDGELVYEYRGFQYLRIWEIITP